MSQEKRVSCTISARTPARIPEVLVRFMWDSEKSLQDPCGILVGHLCGARKSRKDSGNSENSGKCVFFMDFRDFRAFPGFPESFRDFRESRKSLTRIAQGSRKDPARILQGSCKDPTRIAQGFLESLREPLQDFCLEAVFLAGSLAPEMK